MKIYLVRHPETIANAENIMYGWTDYDYTEKGREMLEHVPDYFQGKKVDFLYSSPLGRALNLAKKMGEVIGMKPIEDERIKEMNFGVLEGVSFHNASSAHKEIINQLCNDFENFKVPEGESCQMVYERAKSFFEGIKDKDGTCVVVAHAMLIHMALVYLLDMELSMGWHFKLTPGMVIELEYTSNYCSIHSMTPYISEK